ncbi:sigma-54-dependent Fis family transcriptional regulator [Ammoniphilus sp. YIM 78166]|uniref:sigma-54 interaction domain-containing protein n=1 Tax=Ammoniphilus sp. YIM 78166 TaxID=1644106 RepID=UPI001F0D361D|nr:sigma 54-interacting transcriptional regulator [Ammoniphilus sp. YIM 78166]
MKQRTVTHEMLEAILGAIDEGIHVVDSQGITIYYNHVAAKLDGLSVEEVMGKHLLDVFPSLDDDTSTLIKVIESQEPIYHQHQRYTNMKGKQVITVNTSLPIWVDGELVGAVEVAKDISKVKELSEKLVDLQAQIVQRNQLPKKKKMASKEETAAKYTFTDLISRSRAMDRVKKTGEKAAQTPSPILIMGETGTGKELLVQSIHNASPRRYAPFIAQNCAALPTTLLEGILFGTVKGSFTGAEDRPGLFELADEGTLFLDEINSMPLELQAKLLRVIQENQVRRVGGSKETPIDVRIIAALNEDPQQAVRENRLRSDLFYRLNVVALELPPLRERIEDIPLLTQHFIKKFNYRFGKLVTGLHPDAEAVLFQHSWPGNVRELEHAIEAAMNLVEGDIIEVDDLPYYLQHVPSGIHREAQPMVPPVYVGVSLPEALQRVEEQMIREALAETDGNIMQAAKRLGIPRQTLQYKIAKLDS